MPTANGYYNIANSHNRVGADIIRPQSLHKIIDTELAGCGNLTHHCRNSGTI